MNIISYVMSDKWLRYITNGSSFFFGKDCWIYFGLSFHTMIWTIICCTDKHNLYIIIDNEYFHFSAPFFITFWRAIVIKYS